MPIHPAQIDAIAAAANAPACACACACACARDRVRDFIGSLSCCELPASARCRRGSGTSVTSPNATGSRDTRPSQARSRRPRPAQRRGAPRPLGTEPADRLVACRRCADRSTARGAGSQGWSWLCVPWVSQSRARPWRRGSARRNRAADRRPRAARAPR